MSHYSRSERPASSHLMDRKVVLKLKTHRCCSSLSIHQYTSLSFSLSLFLFLSPSHTHTLTHTHTHTHTLSLCHSPSLSPSLCHSLSLPPLKGCIYFALLSIDHYNTPCFDCQNRNKKITMLTVFSTKIA